MYEEEARFLDFSTLFSPLLSPSPLLDHWVSLKLFCCFRFRFRFRFSFVLVLFVWFFRYFFLSFLSGYRRSRHKYHGVFLVPFLGCKLVSNSSLIMVSGAASVTGSICGLRPRISSPSTPCRFCFFCFFMLCGHLVDSLLRLPLTLLLLDCLCCSMSLS